MHHRDLIGYGSEPPVAEWPNAARVAVSFVVNYEEGGEHAIPDGDEVSETYLMEIAGVVPQPGVRILGAESIFEFGSRVGIWRLLRLFAERSIPATFYVVGRAAERNPQVIQAMAAAGHEIASHHYRWIDYYGCPPEREREDLRRSVAAVERITGQRPVGFYGGRTSLDTRRLVAEDGGFLYESDAYNDELPYWVEVAGRPLLIVPYMLDNNDFKYSTLPAWSSVDDFVDYNKDTFDQLYEEGATRPRMMSVGLHARLSGRPARARALARLLDYIAGHERVWICRRRDIAQHWHKLYPYSP